jgi:tetratricopeptide (TPR) repeat protein
MTTISAPRRFAIAAVTLAAATLLFRGQVASALVTRGDDAALGGDVTRGVHYYERALRFDAGSGIAADRLCFRLLLRRDRGDARTAIRLATSALEQHPALAATLLADRGFAEQQLRETASAERDFATAGAIARDPRYEHLAGRLALAAGRPRDARAHFRRALRDDPHFAPARAALAVLR